MHTPAVGSFLRRSDRARLPTSVRDEELALQRRGIKWLSTAAITWPIWAMTGAPVSLPEVTKTHHHIEATLGIWPAYLMVFGLADIARRARRLYVERDWTAGAE